VERFVLSNVLLVGSPKLNALVGPVPIKVLVPRSAAEKKVAGRPVRETSQQEEMARLPRHRENCSSSPARENRLEADLSPSTAAVDVPVATYQRVNSYADCGAQSAEDESANDITRARRVRTVVDESHSWGTRPVVVSRDPCETQCCPETEPNQRTVGERVMRAINPDDLAVWNDHARRSVGRNGEGVCGDGGDPAGDLPSLVVGDGHLLPFLHSRANVVCLGLSRSVV
jgi:hypothetical protein